MEKVKFVLNKVVLSSEDKDVEIRVGDIVECRLLWKNESIRKNRFRGKVYGISNDEILLDCSYKYSAKKHTVSIKQLLDIEVIENA